MLGIKSKIMIKITLENLIQYWNAGYIIAALHGNDAVLLTCVKVNGSLLFNFNYLNTRKNPEGIFAMAALTQVAGDALKAGFQVFAFENQRSFSQWLRDETFID